MSTSFGSTSPPPAGDIEFSCGSCARVLKVPAHVAGRQAKCPQCGAIQVVPSRPPLWNPAAGPAPPVADRSAARMAPAPPPSGFAPTAPQPQGTASPFSPGANASPTQAPLASAVREPQLAPAVPVQPQAHAASAASEASNRLSPALTLRESLREEAQTRGGGDTPTRRLFEQITAEISKIFVGQEELVLGTLVALFSNGHVLIESVPGLGKTLFVRTLGRVLGCQFSRIQFTADLMPSDITGAPIFDMKTQEFRFRPGPVFTQFLLADEINRAPAKTHAALLEIMQEYRVTVDGKSHTLERPFLVLATQNPIESEGTYNLPEAQLDRFMFKLAADYPQEQEEAAILKLHSTQADINQRIEQDLQTVTSPQEILSIIQQNAAIRVEDRLFDYVNKIVRLTRQWPQFHLGASPRAGIALVQGARSLAAFAGRDYAVPDDVVQIALPALRHRVILTAEAEVEGHSVDELLTEVVRSVEVPRI